MTDKEKFVEYNMNKKFSNYNSYLINKSVERDICSDDDKPNNYTDYKSYLKNKSVNREVCIFNNYLRENP